MNFSEITNRDRSGTEYYEAIDFNEINCSSQETVKKNFKLTLDNNYTKKSDNVNLIKFNTEFTEQFQPKNNIDLNIDMNKINNNLVKNEFEEYSNDNSFDSYQECNDTNKIEDEELKNIKSSLEKVFLIS